VEQVLLKDTSGHRKSRVTGNSKYQFIGSKSYLTNATTFYDKKNGFVDEKRAVGII